NPALVTLLLHHPREALSVLDSLQSEWLLNVYAAYPKAFLYGVADEALGETARAQEKYQAAIPLLETEVQKSPRRPSQRSVLARAYAGVGRKDDALREVNRAAELFPISKDAYFGSWVEISRAQIEARLGDKDGAIERIRHLLSIPCYLSPALLR